MLRVWFPELYQIACDKDVTVADYLCLTGGQLHWNPIFIWEVHDWGARIGAFFS